MPTGGHTCQEVGPCSWQALPQHRLLSTEVQVQMLPMVLLGQDPGHNVDDTFSPSVVLLWYI